MPFAITRSQFTLQSLLSRFSSSYKTRQHQSVVLILVARNLHWDCGKVVDGGPIDRLYRYSFIDLLTTYTRIPSSGRLANRKGASAAPPPRFPPSSELTCRSHQATQSVRTFVERPRCIGLSVYVVRNQ